MNDDTLLAMLKAELEPSDHEIETVVGLGVASFPWLDVDVELAKLLEEESEVLVMRGIDTGRHFTFESVGSVIDVAVIPKGDHWQVVGWIEPIRQFEVRMLTSAGDLLGSAPLDNAGRFKLVLTHRGPIRIEFAEEATISTDWFTPT